MNHRKSITLYVSDKREDPKNTSYPIRIEVNELADLQRAASFDHVAGQHSGGVDKHGHRIKNYRAKRTFCSANCLIMDCDNVSDTSLQPNNSTGFFKTPEDVQRAFPGVAFYVVYSRNHMKVKNGLSARPRFHVYFTMNETKSERVYSEMKKQVLKLFPWFDPHAVDTAHFLFGVENPTVEFYDGESTIDEFLSSNSSLPAMIPEGQRNSTMLRYAEKYLKRLGDSDATKALFEKTAERCVPPLEKTELDSIWENAKSFLHSTIEKNPEYLPPSQYGLMKQEEEYRNKQYITSADVKEVLRKLNITVRLNIISGMVEITGMPPQYSKENASNVLPVLLMDYFASHNIKCSRQSLDDCLLLIQDENRYNPVADMLAHTKHDGYDRITVLKDILGLSDSDRESMYLTKWLHQGIALALNDDTEPYGADGVLVLQDRQGAGKTLFFSTLAVNADWFAEGVSIDIDKKDTIIQSTGCWIAELGELDSTLRREQASLKAFLTASRDTYRLPYARAAVRKPRRTNFCATVNPNQFLFDDTGSRRFWVIHPKRIDVKKLRSLSKEWVMQLWAQVYEQLFLPNPQGFRLTPEERDTLQKENKRYAKLLPGEIEILDQLDFDTPSSKWHWVKVSQVVNELHLWGITSVQAGRVLAKLAENDTRIKVKNTHNVKQYLLPLPSSNTGRSQFDSYLCRDSKSANTALLSE